MKKSLIFCGTPAFAVPALRAVHACADLQIALVVTQPDRPAGRGGAPAAPAVKVAAEALGLPILQPEHVNTELMQHVTEPPDFLVTVAYGELIKPALLAFPRIAPVNVHPSLLPRWRGAAPIQHTILAGDRNAGTTVQIMSAALDAGDVLAQERVPVVERETAATLGMTLADLSAALLVRTLTHPLSPTAQDESHVTFCKKLTREAGRADPGAMTAETIDRMVRALTPWPGVTCAVRGEQVKLHETALEHTTGAIPLPCADGTTLHVVRLQSPGGKVLRGDEWERGKQET